MTRSAPALLVVTAVAVGAGGVGYALEGIGQAITASVAVALVGGLAVWFAPDAAPAHPEIIARPPLGDSPDAVRRRRNEGIGAVVTGAPTALLLAVVAVIAEPPAAKLAAGALVAAVLGWTALTVWASSGRSAFWDRRRLAGYERAVARAEEKRRRYDEELVDRSRGSDRMMRAGRLIAWMHVMTLAVALALVPGLLAEQSGSSAVRTAGTVLSAGLFLVLVVAVATPLRDAVSKRWKRRSRPRR